MWLGFICTLETFGTDRTEISGTLPLHEERKDEEESRVAHAVPPPISGQLAPEQVGGSFASKDRIEEVLVSMPV
jgi:hypothetical protein